MPHLVRLALIALAVAALPACSFSEGGGEFDCTDGAIVTATVDGRSLRADCVETDISSSRVFVGGYDNYDAQDGTDVYSNVRLTVGGSAAGTFPVTGTGSTTLSYFASLGDDDLISVDATAGSVVITSVSSSQISGTFEFSGPEETGTDRTPTGRTVTGTGSFSIPR